MATLLFFGRFSDVADNQTLSLPENVTNTDDLTKYLSGIHVGFGEIINRPGTRIAVGKIIIQSNTDITDADEIAFMSALSGG